MIEMIAIEKFFIPKVKMSIKTTRKIFIIEEKEKEKKAPNTSNENKRDKKKKKGIILL